jgi:predicted nuclease with TOPRIM domain
MAPQRSQRFAQAATNERNRLARKQAQLTKKREDLQSRLEGLDAELEALEQEITILDGLADSERDPATLVAATESADEDQSLLTGGAIRALAVPLLYRERGTAPVHYREWEALLRREGFQIAGKRPEAVFLNQVTRSPLVRATTSAGYYQLDPSAPERLRKQLREQQDQLVELMRQVPRDASGLEQNRQTQRELNSAINKTQRELDEAVNALEAAKQPEPLQARAA